MVPLRSPRTAAPRYQRLTFEVPPEAGCRVGELVDTATEQPIRHGGQIAELVQVVVMLRVSERGVGTVDERDAMVVGEAPSKRDCQAIARDYQEFAERRWATCSRTASTSAARSVRTPAIAS